MKYAAEKLETLDVFKYLLLGADPPCIGVQDAFNTTNVVGIPYLALGYVFSSH